MASRREIERQKRRNKNRWRNGRGTNLASTAVHPGDKTFGLALALLILPMFAGVAGLHRIYLGKYVSGVIWFLTYGLCGFGALFDLATLWSQVDAANRAQAAGESDDS